MSDKPREVSPVRCGCGGEPEVKIESQFYHPYVIVKCEGCGICTKGFPSIHEANVSWNRAMGTEFRTLVKVFLHDAEKGGK